MAIEIFISYRRSDTAGHAGRLHDRLREVFDSDRIFYDAASIEWGDQFPERIDRAVRECCVLLVVMGPDWLTATDDAGKRRLDDEKDFVRREVALGIAEGKKVFTVAVGGARIPRAKDLPPPLAALAECDVAEIGGKNVEYEGQVERLVALIARAHGITPPRMRRQASGPVEPERLASLCDRREQNQEVCDTVRTLLDQAESTRRPFVIVLHGPADEAHGAFVDRLEGFSLPQMLRAGRRAAPVNFLWVRDPLPCTGGQQRFDLRLREALAGQLSVDSLGDEADLMANLRAGRFGAAVAVLGWNASEIACAPQKAIDLVHDYWSRFPDVPAETLVGAIVWLKYDPRRRAGGWLKQLFGGDAKAEALRRAVLSSANAHRDDRRVVWRVLQELPAVTVEDLDRWVDAVGQLIGRFHVPRRALEEIVGAEPCPMDEVLPQLERLIPQS